MTWTAAEHNRLLRAGTRRAEQLEPRLARIVEPILADAGDRAARNFARLATDHLTAAAPAGDSTMVAVFPRPDEAAQLAEPGGEPADLMHVTLAYLGPLDEDAAARVAEALGRVAAEHPPLAGHVGGVGAFDDNGDGTPAILLPDVPGLVELRQAACEAILDAGHDYSRQHGYTPHVTVAYRDSGDDPPARAAIGAPLHFDSLRVVRGDQLVADLPLTGTPALTADASGAAGWTSPAGDELLNVAALAAEIRTKTDPVRLALLQAVMTPALRASGLAWDVTNPLTAQAIAQTGQKVTEIAETTRGNVMRAINLAYNEGLSVPDTAKAIRAGMHQASQTRATLIARTELVGAVNAGSLAATRIVGDETGVVFTKRWLTAPFAKHPRHNTYIGLDGQTVPLHATFTVGADQLQHPGDPAGSAHEVCNCRCTMEYLEAGKVAPPPAEVEVPPDAVADVPADVGEATDALIRGLERSELDRGKVPTPEDLAGARRNWAKQVKQAAVFDEDALAAVRAAAERNAQSGVYQAQVAKHGRDAVVVVREHLPGTNFLRPSRWEGSAGRLEGNRVTTIGEAHPALAGGETMALEPGIGNASSAGLDALLRHEYGHQLEGALSAAERREFAGQLPATDTIRRDLTTYATYARESGESAEAFCELFAVVSDPAYNPADWAPWVRQLGHDWFGAPLEATAEAAPAEQAVAETVAATLTPEQQLVADLAEIRDRATWLTTNQAARQAAETGDAAGFDTYLYPRDAGPSGLPPVVRDQMSALLDAGARLEQEMTPAPAGAAEQAAAAKRDLEALVSSRNKAITDLMTRRGSAQRAWRQAEDDAYNRAAIKMFGRPYGQLGDYADKQKVLLETLDDETVNALKMRYYQVVDEVEAEKVALFDAERAAKDRATEARSAIAAHQRDEALRVLRMVRELGPGDETERLRYVTLGAKRGAKKAQKLLDQAQEYLPRDWLTNTRPAQVGTKARGYHLSRGTVQEIYTSDRASAVVGDADGLPVAVHELGHEIEATNELVLQAERSFYEWRTRGGTWDGEQEKIRQLSTLRPGWGYGRGERARPDEFTDPYMGKAYTDGRAYELVSMGLESMFTGSYELDVEYRRFMLGLLALL